MNRIDKPMEILKQYGLPVDNSRIANVLLFLFFILFHSRIIRLQYILLRNSNDEAKSVWAENFPTNANVARALNEGKTLQVLKNKKN